MPKETEIGSIPEDWEVSELGDICSVITDGSHFSPKEESSQYYMASVKDMRYDYFSFESCKTISKTDFNSLVQSNCSPNKGDILISKDGANCLDLIFVYDQPEKIVLLSSIAIARLKEGFDPYFYRYFLLAPTAQYLMRNSFVSGSAIPRVVLKDFRKVLIPSIPYTEQNSISSVLKSLDAKIALLKRQNMTLEQLAETLFRQWFVEEPENSWEEKGLDEIAEFLNGLACQKFPVRAGEVGLPVIKIKELRTGITDASDRATNNVPEKYLVQNGDLLFSWSGSLDTLIWAEGTGVLNQHLFKVSSNEFPQWFYYLWIKHHLPEFQGIAEDKATTMGHIQRHHLSNAKVLVPPKNILDIMDETISPIFQKLKNNQKQIRSLIQLRDTLLPKLMTGEIRITDHAYA